ncbi:hypothetical protein ACTORR_17725 [Pseudomonas sp. SAR267]|uniref:hypothetical protein n=1 Tax=unclassified Pseudomonas TaxID=196821 RepID=UPI0028A947AC|nr:hypothetical protein [Pseudomonas sp.]
MKFRPLCSDTTPVSAPDIKACSDAGFFCVLKKVAHFPDTKKIAENGWSDLTGQILVNVWRVQQTRILEHGLPVIGSF